MSTRTVESPDLKSMQIEQSAPTPAHSLALPWGTELSGTVYQSLAAINTTCAGFTSRRLKENLSLPEQLGGRKSLSEVVRVYGAYCRTALEQYEAVFAQFQQIGLNLASEAPVVGLLPVRITPSQHEHIARSPDRSARDCFP